MIFEFVYRTKTEKHKLNGRRFESINFFLFLKRKTLAYLPVLTSNYVNSLNKIKTNLNNQNTIVSSFYK